VIAGIWPLTSLRNAEFMKNDLRVSVPDQVLVRMQQADTPELARAEGVRIAQEMLRAARQMGYGGIQGVQVSAPFGRYTVAAEVIAEVLPAAAGAAESAPVSQAAPDERLKTGGLQVGNV
jgi:homocysteine S-methyltransferase